MAFPRISMRSQEFTAQGTDEALADRIHPRSLEAVCTIPRPGGLEDGVERDSKVRFVIADQKPEALEPLAEGESEVVGLPVLSSPDRVRGDAARCIRRYRAQ